MTKLIRDRLARRVAVGIQKSGSIRLARDQAEFEKLLRRKLDEEVMELKDEVDAKGTPNPDRIIEECADVLEVLSEIAHCWGSASFETLVSAMKQKQNYNGGFAAGVVLETKD